MSTIASEEQRGDWAVIGAALRAGWDDFRASPTVGIVLVAVYPVIGLVLYRIVFNLNLLPLLFPLAAGFAIVGPIASLGFYELSRRREHGEPLDKTLAHRSLTFGEIGPAFLIGVLLLVLYGLWILSARVLHVAIMGPEVPPTMQAFLQDVFTTAAGWALIASGSAVGLVFALCVLAVGAISLPAVVDKGIAASEAIGISVRAFRAHPALFLKWGLVVLVFLFAGSLPAFLGLVVVLPLLGHATFHLYRQLSPPLRH